MKQTKHFLRPLLMAIVMMVGMLVPQGAWAQYLWVDDGETVTISEDASYDGIDVDSGGELIINEGVTLTVTVWLNINGNDINDLYGTVINYGTIIGEGQIHLQGGVLANHGHIDLDSAIGNGTFYNTGTLGDGYFNLTTTPCDHDYENFTVEATCTHGAGTQYRCNTCYYMRLDETSGALPHSFNSHNGINICSSCGQKTYDAPTVGEGSEEDPYQIANAGNLYWFADYTINENNYANAILTADIVLNDGTFATDGTFTATGADEPSKPFPWLRIGDADGYYYGTFDGNGHTISGMYVNGSFGLFYDLFGSVVNLGLINCYIRDDDSTGAICSWNYGTISNCYTTGILSGSYSSGICDTNDVGSTISNCYSTCTFVYDTNFYGGGICGTNNGTISNCYTSDNTTILHDYETASEVYGGVSAERFASGEIAYKLNGSVDGEGSWTAGATDGTQAWYQKLGENGDSYPVLAAAEGNTVYYGYENCLSESAVYSNNFLYADIEDAHDFTSHTLTDGPVTSGLYAYVCDRDCGAHSDNHIIKDFNGEGNHLELTKDGEGNYSTSEDITLADANGFVSPVSFAANSVTYSRQMTNEWGTIVLPFAINYDADNTNYNLYQLTAATGENLTFTEYDDEAVIPAGTPMAVKAIGDKNDADKYVITLTAAGNAVSAAAITPSAEVGGLTMDGTYTNIASKTDVYFIAQNQFWWAEEAISIAPFRAWFVSDLGDGGNEDAKVLNIVVNEEADGIASINAANDMKNGKYLENGHVVIVKNGKKFNLNGQEIK